MDGLDFTLAGFIICALLLYAAAIVFTVYEYRRWKLSGWVIALAVILFVVSPFIFPVVEHIARPKMRACGVDRRIINLKLALAWFVPIFSSVGNGLCTYFCNRVVDRDFSGELALCCNLSCLLLYLVFMIWCNARLNALSDVCPAKTAR